MDGVWNVPPHLTHPQSVRARRHAGDLDFSRGQINKEKSQEALQSCGTPYVDCEESAATIKLQSCARSSFQLVLRLRSGAGRIPCRGRTAAIVLRASLGSKFDIAPSIRR